MAASTVSFTGAGKGRVEEGRSSHRGYGAKDGGYVANVRTVITPDGRKLGGFQYAPGDPAK